MGDNCYVQQLTVYDTFTLCGQFAEIDHTLGQVEIKSVALLDTTQGKSYEGQYLSGKELFISGIMKADVYYYCGSCRNLHKAAYCIPFSTYIIVSENLSEASIDNIMCCVIELSAIMIMPKRLFVNGIILVEYIDEG